MNILKTLLGVIAPRVVDAVIPGGGMLLEGIVRGVTGDKDTPIEELEKQIADNPELLAQVKQAVMEKEIALEQEATKQFEAQVENMGQVNETMQAELDKGEKFQKYWRPANGYLFGITLFINYGLTSLANILLKAFSDPIILKNSEVIFREVHPASIPEMVFSFWAGVVGVAVHSRGKEKLAKLGNNGPNLLQTIVAGLKK
jgi:uncharacterized coiled-coil protein SlyX